MVQMADGSFLMSGKKARVKFYYIYNIYIIYSNINIRKIYLLSVIPLPKKLPSAICTTFICFVCDFFYKMFGDYEIFKYLCRHKKRLMS